MSSGKCLTLVKTTHLTGQSGVTVVASLPTSPSRDVTANIPIQKCKEMFDLNSKKLEVVDTYTHIGIERTSGVTVAGEIGEKAVKTARRTAYSLMGAGFHGYNGINPKVSIRLWNVYIVF